MSTPVACLVALFAPLVVSVIGLFTWRRFGNAVSWLSITAIALGTTSAVAANLPLWNGAPSVQWAVPWLSFAGTNITLTLGVHLDSLAGFMLLLVQVLALGVLLYSRWYLHHDRFYGKFFAFFSFFVFAMNGVVLAENLLQAFFFWELVGLGSYLLIGYWHDKPAASEDPEYQANKPLYATGIDESQTSPSHAQLKAFLLNRVDDFGFLSGLALLAAVVWNWSGFSGGNPLSWDTLFTAVSAGAFAQIEMFGLTGNQLLTLAGILVFLGAMGKSAQFPFHVWLPDAMQGPTTASAIIHAATMVAAGVFLTARVYPILTPETLVFIQWIGGITAFVAATIACVQWDFKAVLAYSTVSQLGFMMIGLGAGAAAGGYSAGVGHLFTHAIFKCMLFLGAAAVIHALHGVQDLNRMGGLARRMPFTALATGVGTLAILGVPFFSAFWSKDAILAAAHLHLLQTETSGGCTWLAAIPFWLGIGTAGLTAFYMSRQWFLAFWGTPRDAHLVDHAHDPDRISIAVLLVLSVLCLQMVWTGSWNPAAGEAWFSHALGTPTGGLLSAPVEVSESLLHHLHVQTMLQAIALVCAGVGVSWFLYVYRTSVRKERAIWLRRLPPTNLLWQFLANLWLWDRLWMKLVAPLFARVFAPAVAHSDLAPNASLDWAVDTTASSPRLLGRFFHLFQSGRSGAYAGWTALFLFGTLALFLLF